MALIRSPQDSLRSATVPFFLDHNRMMVELQFVRPDGTIRPAVAWVDTGNESLLLAEPLARDLGFDTLSIAPGDHSVALNAPTPPIRFGGLPLSVEGVETRVFPCPYARPGVPAEANLPASLLLHDHVVFDYPAGRMTVARPGVLEPRGTGVPCRVKPETGLFLVTCTADGDTLQLGLDNGSAGTWISNKVIDPWLTRHPDWPRARGAAGSANFFGFPFELGGTLFRLPELDIGPLPVRGATVLGLDQSLFDWYSRKSAGPVVGFIGANVLRNFRLEIDFPNLMTYWEAGPATGAEDLDIVPLNLRPEVDNSITISGAIVQADTLTIEDVHPGDKLIRVGDLEVEGAHMGAAVDALRGTPGSTRTLVLERDGERITVDAKVLRLP